MSNVEGEDRARAAEVSSEAAGSQLEALGDRTDASVQSPAGLGADNPHGKTGMDLGQAQMQERMDKINAEGRIGSSPDPTPSENYSLLTPPDAPTPETHPELAAQLDANVRGNAFTDHTLTTGQREAGAEDVGKAPGTKTPSESQPVSAVTSSETKTDDEASVQALVSQGFSEEDARAQVATWKEGRQ